MNNEKDTIDKLFSKKINHLNKSEKQKFEKYNFHSFFGLSTHLVMH